MMEQYVGSLLNKLLMIFQIFNNLSILLFYSLLKNICPTLVKQVRNVKYKLSGVQSTNFRLNKIHITKVMTF